jgi:ribosomal protein S18 acetylase RimI-like enzyme
MAQKPRRNRVPRKEAFTQLAFEPATIKDVDTLVAFERKVADAKIYGPTLDVPGAVQAITSNQFYLIKMGDIVVGTAAYRSRPDESVYISNVAIDTMYRRRGIARAAMSLILGKLKATRRIDLVTHPENKKALHLYASFGFKVESRQENYFGDGEPRLVLALTRPVNSLGYLRTDSQ